MLRRLLLASLATLAVRAGAATTAAAPTGYVRQRAARRLAAFGAKEGELRPLADVADAAPVAAPTSSSSSGGGLGRGVPACANAACADMRATNLAAFRAGLKDGMLREFEEPRPKCFDFGDMLDRYWRVRLCALGAGVRFVQGPAGPFRSPSYETEGERARNAAHFARRALVLSLPLDADDAARLLAPGPGPAASSPRGAMSGGAEVAGAGGGGHDGGKAALAVQLSQFDCRGALSLRRMPAVQRLVQTEVAAAMAAFEKLSQRTLPTPLAAAGAAAAGAPGAPGAPPGATTGTPPGPDVVAAIHFRCGNILDLDEEWGTAWRLVKFAWYLRHLPPAAPLPPPPGGAGQRRRRQRVLIIGQYSASNAKDDFVQESNASNLEQCSAIMDALAAYLRRHRPGLEVVLGSSGLNEDFATLVRAPLMLGSGSRFSVQAALANPRRAVLPMNPLVPCASGRDGLRWAVAPLLEFAPLAPGKNNTLSSVIASLEAAVPADYKQFVCSPEALGCEGGSCSFHVPQRRI